MTDLIKLLLKAGNGGRGRVSFRRERRVAKGGPDGGDGGDGGHIIIRADKNLASLREFAGKTTYEAGHGQPGGKRKKTGARGEDVVLTVPIGTELRLLAENKRARTRRLRYGLKKLFVPGDIKRETYELEQEGQAPPAQEQQVVESIDEGESELLATLSEHGQELIISQGGFGGHGNTAYKSSRRTTPLIAEFGSPGEERLIQFELKLWADVGLVGFPNAGKSTLLSVLTKARPKVAAYPFTTIEPHLGVLAGTEKELVIADIPGLIQGASQGKGLGLQFLRHVEHCRTLLFLLSLTEAEAQNEELSLAERAELLWQQYQDLLVELNTYEPKLLKKNRILVINKIDIYSQELQESIGQFFSQKLTKDRQVIVAPQFISAATMTGVDSLKKLLLESTAKI